jgi:hypothetical protein
VRDVDEFNRITHYIENNPVKAGFAAHPEEYPWSSANLTWRNKLRSHECERGTPRACATLIGNLTL